MPGSCNKPVPGSSRSRARRGRHHAQRCHVPAPPRARQPRPALPFGRVDAVVSLQVIEHLWISGTSCPRPGASRDGRVLVHRTASRSPGLGRGQKPTNPFHVEEFDVHHLQELVREAGFTDITMFGVRPGPRLAERPGLIAEQIEAAVSGTWPAELEQFVAGVRTDDFLVTDTDLDTSLDLVVVAS